MKRLQLRIDTEEKKDTLEFYLFERMLPRVLEINQTLHIKSIYIKIISMREVAPGEWVPDA